MCVIQINKWSKSKDSSEHLLKVHNIVLEDRWALDTNTKVSPQLWSMVKRALWFSAVPRIGCCASIEKNNPFYDLSRDFTGECQDSSSWLKALERLGDPKHTSKSTKGWKREKKMFSWSPDLELIQMPWHNPKRAELSRQPRNIHKMKQICGERWPK